MSDWWFLVAFIYIACVHLHDYLMNKELHKTRQAAHNEIVRCGLYAIRYALTRHYFEKIADKVEIARLDEDLEYAKSELEKEYGTIEDNVKIYDGEKKIK